MTDAEARSVGIFFFLHFFLGASLRGRALRGFRPEGPLRAASIPRAETMRIGVFHSLRFDSFKEVGGCGSCRRFAYGGLRRRNSCVTFALLRDSCAVTLAVVLPF